MRQRRDAFPAGLYGLLLAALCGLTVPSLFAPIERLLLGVLSFVPRAVGEMTGRAAAAAEPDRAARVDALAHDLAARLQAHDLDRAPQELLRTCEPLSCGVLTMGKRRGGGRQPCEFTLDRSYADLADCEPFVTKGDVLLGFLLRAGRGLAAEEPPTAGARVVLLNHPAARAVAAGIELPGGTTLRVVVDSAATVDPAALRVSLWEDASRAAHLDADGLEVRTVPLTGLPGELPAGLWLGRTRVWGYQGLDDGLPLPIGVFVAPPIEPSALSHVVVWRRRAGGAIETGNTGAAHTDRLQATVLDLPGATAGRHLLAAHGAVPDGAAVVQDGSFLGTARGLSFGLGLVTSFAASRQPWNLLLLPDDPAARPREIRGEVEAAGPNGDALLRWRGDTIDGPHRSLPPGELFTGSNGPHCPSGLYVGRLRPHAGATDLAWVTPDAATGPRAAEVVVGGGGR